MRIPFTLLLIFSIQLSCYSQRSITGFVRDESTGENLIGATLLDQTSGGGTTSNSYGHYSLQVKSNPVTILVSYVGYDRLTITLNIHSDTTVNIGLKSAGILEEVTINASRVEKIQDNSSMSRFTIPIEQIKSIPTLMGERDLMKVLQLLPGVQSGNEGSTGLYVRGGGPDQNLILLDGVPIYNASHLYGFFSTFNSDAINHVELVKGGFPARYGGRLSSVVDISMREGNKDKIKARGTIGAISAKALVEGPINSKSTFLFSARRSYLNLLKIGAIADDAQKVSQKYYLFDLNGRLNYTLNKNNRIFLSGYKGGDKASTGSNYEAEDYGIKTSDTRSTTLGWGNTLVALRWNHVYGPKLFSNVATTYSKYRFNTATKITDIKDDGTNVDKTFYNYDYVSGITDVAARLDFDYTPGNRQYIRFGSGVTHHTFSPGVLAITSKDSIQSGQYSASKLGANEGFVYIEDDIEITSKLKVNAGVHATAFFVEGKTYHSVQPRISARYLLNDKVSLKASYATMSQFVHLLTNSGVGLPTDLWVPSTARIRPQYSRQYALGAAGTWNDFEVSIEGYYKDMNNVIEYKDGASYLSTNQNWQNKVEVGRGNSYGTEFFIQKKIGKFNGWVGYTLSWTNRQFDKLNEGRWFPYRYDRRHDIKIAGTYHVTKNFELGAVWVYNTGQALTFPTVIYFTADVMKLYQYGLGGSGNNPNGGYVEYAPSRNNFRMTAYHRLDLSATYTIDRPKFSHEFNLSVYNAYNRKNPYYIQLWGNQQQTTVRQVSLIALVPSISYSINLK